MGSRIWNHIVPLLGAYPLRDIDATTLRTFKSKLLSRVETSTAETLWIHLTTIFNTAVDDMRLAKSPCKAYRTVKAPRRTKKKAKAWGRSTVEAVRDAPPPLSVRGRSGARRRATPRRSVRAG